MFVGRFFMIVPAMAIAGSLAARSRFRRRPARFPTTGGLFVGLVVGVILIIGGLTFFPALALGPIVEHLAGERQHPVLIDRIFGVTSMEAMKLQKKVTASTMLDPKITGACDQVGLRQARPAADDQEPRDVRGRDRGDADHGHLRARPRHRRRKSRIHVPDHPVAVVHGAVRQFRRSRRRRPRQGAGRDR